ncbi:DUF3710 domain-containing protein [Mangrovihabitans endophyticus]|uniref:DUF3710 domain-containing protein n=1 Tax=Mangrovihabitans endophyticus TaxID=1751298 RepID=A0A8J3FRS4_9ACTN|nr:DUF3710 domain-containing protein [Mangrovihabitans endophyticus]GGL14007.1 hypothetical protein GCM10012284_56000 [Mangrovihabitans endophyticus]
MFSRKRGGPRHVRTGDAPPSEVLAQSMADMDAEAPAPEHGPYDVKHAPAGTRRLDLGSLQIPAVEGVEVRVQANPDGGVEQVVLVDGDSALQLGVFAAPRTEGIWGEVRDEIAASMKADGVTSRELTGPYGVELAARVNTPDGPAEVRFVGVDGPRWMVRALYQGRVAQQPGAEGTLGECLAGLVVVRDDEPRPVREPLPLRLPQEMAQHAQEHGEQMPQANGQQA